MTGRIAAANGVDGAHATPEQPAEDFIQSTAGSSESKKDQ